MASVTQDFRDKMKLEDKLDNELITLFNRIVNSFELRSRNRVPFNVDQVYHEQLRVILLNHYQRVDKIFSNRIRPGLPREVTSTVEEDRLIRETLDQFNRVRAEIQATNINNTTQKNIAQALAQAMEFDTDTDKLEDGKVSSKARLVGFELILTAKAILKRTLKGRRSGIVNTETQTPAEVSKLTEAEVLVGLQPSISGGELTKVPVTKFWVTQGDSRVRDTHLDADGQERKFNEPFIVGGFPLKVPGDTSLGAPLKETINCRCAAEFDNGEIAAFRFDKLREEQFIVRG